MTTPPFPELAVIAKVENVEAVAQNIEDAVLFEIGAIVGTEDAATAPFSAGASCEFAIGDGVINNTVEAMLKAICQGFTALSLRFLDIADALADSIRNFLDGFLASVVSTFTNLVQTLTDRLTSVVFAVVDRIEKLVATIVDTLSGLVGALVDQVRKVISQMEEILGAIFTRIGTVVTAILGKIEDVFTGLLAVATSVVDRIGAGISAVIAALVAAVDFVFDRVGGALTSLIESLTGVAEGGLAKIREVIENIPAVLREIFAEARDFIVPSIGTPLSNMGDILITQIEAFFGKLIDDLDVSPGNILREFLTGIGIPADEVERFANAADSAMPRAQFTFVAAALAIIPFVMGPLISAILSPAIQEIQQEVAQRVTPTLIPPENAIDALFRGEIDEAKFRKELGEAGYSVERMDILTRSARRLLDLGQVFQWWLRDLITEPQLDALLEMHRISDEDKALLKQSVFFIPPVQDLIRMAVREVFSPEIRERFGQDEGFPVEFATFSKQQGVSEEWARSYWAAHWILPSAQQGFEMLHRKVISEQDLDLLLRAQDVMPFWREKLKQIAFSPLTRVDLRRMHKLGLLDVEQLQSRYEDLGFAPDNAALMVQFTLAFNFDDTGEAEQEIEGLTRATVVNMFEDGILQENEALEILGLMGLSQRVSELFIEQRKLEVSRSERSALIESVISLVGGGVINFPQAQDSLASIGLTATEIAKATQRIISKIGGRKRLPTPVQLEKMLALEIISEDLWRETMGGLDFPEEWTERILQLSRTGPVA